ncbi:hypothetical protein [Streptomyces olivoreticuli]|uniref:hypothetical protein n=1 Tax=Streptomyces olivoreticuli TaxID=68246 RepID=UPI000E285FCA|nr:hypothetical protein [Streptomyces olivoreticuli]
MPVFPGTAMPLSPKPERPTLQQRLHASVAEAFAPSGLRLVDDDHKTALDAGPIQATIDSVLDPVSGPGLGSDDLAKAIKRLKGHLGLLIPVAAGAHPELVASVGRRLQYEPPDAHQYPECARQWAEESARAARQLLGLAVADEGAEQWHTEGGERPEAPNLGRDARPHPPVDQASE